MRTKKARTVLTVIRQRMRVTKNLMTKPQQQIYIAQMATVIKRILKLTRMIVMMMMTISMS